MKKLSILVFGSLILGSCGTYRYYTLPVNQATFANRGEVQLSGNVGSSGAVAKGGIAVTDKLLLAGQYNGDLGGAYTSNEWEGAVGINISEPEAERVNAFYGGYGAGSNFKLDSGVVLKDYFGNFSKFFVQFGSGTTQKRIGDSRVRVGSNYALKLNYIDYRGYKLSSNDYARFTASNFYLEMYAGGNIGGKFWRLEYGTAFVVKTDLKVLTDKDHNLRILPIHFNLGLQIIIGRKYLD